MNFSVKSEATFLREWEKKFYPLPKETKEDKKSRYKVFLDIKGLLKQLAVNKKQQRRKKSLRKCKRTDASILFGGL